MEVIEGGREETSDISIEKVYTNGGDEAEVHTEQVHEERPPKEHPTEEVEAEGCLEAAGDTHEVHLITPWQWWLHQYLL